MKKLSKADQKKIAKVIRDSIDDKEYIKNQVKAGKAIDNSKLKAGKIAKVSL